MAGNNRQKTKACRNLTREFEELEKGAKNDSSLSEQCRNANLENEINGFLSGNLESKIRKWNFDFANEVPLEGDWEWYVDSQRRDCAPEEAE